MTDRLHPDDERVFAFRRLPADETAPGEAREWTAKVLAGWDAPGLADDVRTVVSELVTNALRARATAINALIEWDWAGDAVEVQVGDDAPGRPEPRRPDFVAETGRGLFIVAALATDWGHRAAEGGGKVVWARFTVERSR